MDILVQYCETEGDWRAALVHAVPQRKAFVVNSGDSESEESKTKEVHGNVDAGATTLVAQEEDGSSASDIERDIKRTRAESGSDRDTAQLPPVETVPLAPAA